MGVLQWLSFITLLSLWVPAQSLPADNAAVRKVAGCGKTLILRGIDVFRKVDNGRSYWYRLPPNYDKNKQYPVVFGFHGSSRLGGFFDGLAFAADNKLSLSKYSHDVRSIFRVCLLID
jgi:hypothetical protein